MTRAEIERRLRQARWPEPAAELRARVLAAAPIVNRPVTWSDRVWFSRAWRVAAAAAAAAAIAIAVVAGRGGFNPVRPDAAGHGGSASHR